MMTNQHQSDARLLEMTYSKSYPEKLESRARTCKWIAWIGGTALIGTSACLLFLIKEEQPIAAVMAGAGVLCIGGFYFASYRLNKKARDIRRATLVENTIFQSGKNRLNAGIDLLSDRSQHALGVGLSFTF